MKGKKSIRFTMIVLVALMALVFAVTLVACNNKDVKLSFVTNGGTPQASISVKAGEEVTLPELADKTESGRTYVFDGWSLNSDLSGETYRGKITAPNSDTTYYAKWVLAVFTVKYFANAPEGTVAQGTMNDVTFSKGQTATAAECAYTVLGCRFLGWMTSEDGEVADYAPGDTIPRSEDGTLSLYALWNRGLEDALGGSDYLYFVDDEPDSIILSRNGLEDKKGEYDSQTRSFTFKDGGSTIVAGKVTGDYFYYYNEALMKKDGFVPVNGNSRQKLVIGEQYSATYTDEKGKAKQGEVTFDPDGGFYEFRATDDSVVRFVLQSESGELKLYLQDMEEAGYYATTDGYPVIYLDGLGNFTYYFDPEHPTYYDQVTGEALMEAYGTYVKEENAGLGAIYHCEMHFGYSHLEDFLFRINSYMPPKQVDGYELKSSSIERSTFYGDLDPVGHTLNLNGFGGGTYTDEEDQTHSGTYDIVRNWWMTVDGVTYTQTWLINFNYQGGTDNIYYALRQANDGAVTAEFFGKVKKGEVGGLYSFSGAITISGETYGDAFIMMLVDKNNETMILVKIDERSLSSGATVPIYAPMYTGTVKKATGDLYHFETLTGDSQMNFRINSQNQAEYAKDSGEGGIGEKQIAEGIIVDPNTSTATCEVDGNTYNDVHYSYVGGDILEFYTFNLSDTEKLYYYREVHGESETFTRAYAQDIFDYAYEVESLANAFPARLLFEKNSNKAFLAIPMAIGDAYFVGYGTYTQVEGSDDEYLYQNARFVDNILDFFGGDGFSANVDQFNEYYSKFTLRREVGEDGEIGKFYSRKDDMYFDLNNFKSTGYNDKATYTLDSGTSLNGTFYRMEIIIVFTSEDGNIYYLKENATTHKMTNVSEDAGLYYLYLPDDLYYMTFGPTEGGNMRDYIVYDGESEVTIVSYTNGYLRSETHGRIQKTEQWSETFREYEIVEDETEEVFEILLGTFTSLFGDEFLIYDRYDASFEGDWQTEDGGTLHGDGYRLHSAYYDEDGDGTADYTGLMTRAKFDKTDIETHAYTEDPEGDVIVFTYNVTEEQTSSIVFNIVTSKTGVKYLVERKLIFGAFALWEAGTRSGEYMYLDGNGSAELYSATGELLGRGSYGLDPDINDYSYYYEDSANDERFNFAISIETESGGQSYFEYRKYTKNLKGRYFADDWSLLTMSSYGEITYTDRYGVVYEGYYRVENAHTVTLVTYDGSGLTFTFNFSLDDEYFELVG